MREIVKLDRRDFLRLGGMAGGGLVLGVHLGEQQLLSETSPLDSASSDLFQPNAFVRIDTDDTVSIWVAKVEMGQGVRTALPMIVADELDADWDRVKVIQADAHPDKYGRQMTVGSFSVRGGSWMPLRRAGAAAREMLLAAAAAHWGVAAADCRTESSRVIHPASGRALGYGALAEAAAALPVPEEPTLKDPGDFRLIGKSMPNLDTPAKVQGKATFGLDVRVPNMLYATVVHCPVFGGTLASFEAGKAKQVPGVKEIVEVSQGVAVVAENTWAAFAGAEALEITWDPGDFSMDSAEIYESFAQLADGEAAVARSEGDVGTALLQAQKRIEATYEVPYLAHATMEPMNCTAHVQADSCEIWCPTQSPQGTQRAAAEITGFPVENITVHVTFLGCGLGRRSRTDFVQDAVETSMKVGAPVQLVWTRQEDMQHDFYRPATYNRFEGGLDADGRLAALKLRIVAPPIFRRRGRNGVDGSSVDGAANMPYAIPNLLVDYCRSEVPVPVGHWRSVGPSQNTFIVESFIDELAHAAGRDPVEFRLELLGEQPRLRYALELAAEKSGWGTPPSAGRARGVGVVINKGGHVAQIAEVSAENGRVRVHRVTCAVDCGQIIHPDIVEAQTVGCVVNGLAAALHSEITIEGGAVKQSNFHDYRLLRMNEMPEVDVHLVESTEEPGGAGEPALPPTAPAVANALFALTGTRIRKLPIDGQTL